jgi:hypothetical protein
MVDYKARPELSPLRVPQLFRCAGDQSKTKVSSEHRAHNKPKNLSPDITKEGLSPVKHRRSSEERPQHYRVQESYANKD